MPLLRLSLRFTTIIAGAALLAFIHAPLVAPSMADETKQPDVPKCEDVESIGAATMDTDGVITMRLRSLPPGPIGEGQFVYKPGDRDYKSMIGHLGGIAPGETKSVKPWC